MSPPSPSPIPNSPTVHPSPPRVVPEPEASGTMNPPSLSASPAGRRIQGAHSSVPLGNGVQDLFVAHVDSVRRKSISAEPPSNQEDMRRMSIDSKSALRRMSVDSKAALRRPSVDNRGLLGSATSLGVTPIETPEESQEVYWRVSKVAHDRWRRALSRVRIMVMFKRFEQKEKEEEKPEVKEPKEHWVFDPDTPAFGVWALVTFLVVVYNIFSIPFRWGFDPKSRTGFYIIDYLTDIILWLDIALAFYTPVQVGADVITDKNEIKKYLKSSKFFILDVITAIPLDLIFVMASMHRTAIYIRLIRLFWIHRIESLSTRWERRTILSPLVFKLMKMGLYIIVIAHVVGCSWFKVGFHEAKNHPINWISEDNLEDGTISRKYVRSLYWAVCTLTTVGYGNIIPMTEGETWFTVIVMLIGQSTYAYIIGTIATVLQSKDKLNADFKKKMDELRVWVRWRELPQSLGQRLVQFYEYLWGTNRGIDEQALLEDLPTGLKNEVAYFLNQDTLRKVPIFQTTDQHFISMLASKLRSVIVGPEDFVIRYGEIGVHMYLMRKGNVKVLSPDCNTQYAKLGEGSFFGEMALLKSEPRNANVQAITYCELFSLHKDDLAAILSDFPEYRERIYAVAADRERRNEQKTSSTQRTTDRRSSTDTSNEPSPGLSRAIAAGTVTGDVGPVVGPVTALRETLHRNSSFGPDAFPPNLNMSTGPATPGHLPRTGARTPLLASSGLRDSPSSDAADDGGESIDEDIRVARDSGEDDGSGVIASSQPVSRGSHRALAPLPADAPRMLLRPSSLPRIHMRPSEDSSHESRPRGSPSLSHDLDDDENLIPRSTSCKVLLPALSPEGSVGIYETGIYENAPLPGVPHSPTIEVIEEKSGAEEPAKPKASAMLAKKRWKDLKKYATAVGTYASNAKRASEYREKEKDNDIPAKPDPDTIPWYNQAILPSNTYYQLWDLFLFFGILYNAFIVPVRIAYGLRKEPMIFFLDYMWDISGWIGILVMFRVAISRRGILARDLVEIRRAYLRGWFAWDLISLLPLDLILMASTSDYQLVALARLPRLIRVAAVPKKFTNWEKQSRINAILLRVCKLSFWILLMAHWSGTVWFQIGEAEEDGGRYSWTRHDGLQGASVGKKWVRSLYWAVTTLTTVGYGDIRPFTESETVYAIFMMLAGQSLYAFIIGTMSTLVANADALGTDFQRKVERVTAYMRWRNLPEGLRAKIHRYLEYLWFINKGIDEQDVLGQLSGSLRADVSLLLNKDVVRSVPIFKDCADTFITLVVTSLQSKIVGPGDYIIRKGDAGREVFILRLGVVEVVSNGKVLATLNAPTYFGEAALLTSEKRNASIRSKTYCEVFVLTQEDFERILEDFPGYRERMLYISLKRQAKHKTPPPPLPNSDDGSDIEEVLDDEASFSAQDADSSPYPAVTRQSQLAASSSQSLSNSHMPPTQNAIREAIRSKRRLSYVKRAMSMEHLDRVASSPSGVDVGMRKGRSRPSSPFSQSADLNELPPPPSTTIQRSPSLDILG